MNYKFFHITLLLACAFGMTSCEEKKADATGVFESQSVTISPKVSGSIIAINIKEGDTVSVNQELALIDTMQYHIQRKQLLVSRQTMNEKVTAGVQTDALKVQIEQLEREKQRVENLIAVGAATKREAEQLDNQIQSLRSQIKAASEEIAGTDQVTQGQRNVNKVQVESINETLKNCHVISPISGIVMSVFASKGEVAAAGQHIAKISDLDHVWLMAYFPGSKLSSIKLGQKVRVKTLYGGDKEQEYAGTITWIASESQFTPKSVPTADERANIVYAVKIEVKNDGKIRPGLSGEVWLK